MNRKTVAIFGAMVVTAALGLSACGGSDQGSGEIPNVAVSSSAAPTEAAPDAQTETLLTDRVGFFQNWKWDDSTPKDVRVAVGKYALIPEVPGPDGVSLMFRDGNQTVAKAADMKSAKEWTDNFGTAKGIPVEGLEPGETDVLVVTGSGDSMKGIPYRIVVE